MKPVQFIQEPIEVIFKHKPIFEKRPGPPAGFIWRGMEFHVIEILSEWHDYRRQGRMARNMQAQHASHAELRGSWGVGKDYFRARTQDGRIFDLYYDRAPQDVDKRKGAWFLFREMSDQL